MRHAVRSLFRKPVFAVTSVLTIAIGIGANTALFGVIYSVLIRPLPFRDPARLVEIWETHPALAQLQASAPDFEDWRSDTRSFDEISAYTLSAMNNTTLLGQGEPAHVHATMANHDLFDTLGVRLVAGRVFSVAEEQSKQQVALLSENLWRRKFNSDPAVIGRQIRLETQSFRVLGIVPQRQAFPAWADLWIPLSLLEPELQSRRKYHPLEVVARLKNGVAVSQAQSEIQTLARRLAQAHPDTNAKVGAYVIPLAQQITGGIRPSLLVTGAAVSLVLLIACANLAHLFLGRMAERNQEMAIREALGARPWHLARQLLGESFWIAAMGGVLGLLLGFAAGPFAFKMAANQIPNLEATSALAPVSIFAVAITLVAGLLFGLPACSRVLRSRGRISESGRSVVRSHSRLSAALTAAEVAMALFVLSGTALLTRSFAKLLDENPGFNTNNVLVVPNLTFGSDWSKSEEFLYAQLLPTLRSAPGVIAAAGVNSAPMSLGPAEHSRYATRFGVEGRTFDAGSYPVAQNRWITPDYFRVLGIALHRGRLLTEADRGSARILINETLAQRFYPRGDAVGKRLVLGVMDQNRTYPEIVGVVGDTRDMGLDQPVEFTLYGLASGPVMTILVKTNQNSPDFSASVRNAIQRVNPEIAVSSVQPLKQNLVDSFERRRVALVLLSIFGGLAAFLTAGGIFAVLSQSVNSRIREFGVRAAVGAAPGDVVSLVLGEALLLAVPGLLAGALLFLSFARLMKNLVYQISPADPMSTGASAIVLLFVILVSAWMPARRAARVNPIEALRVE